MTKIILIAITAIALGLGFYLPQLPYLDQLNKNQITREKNVENVKEFVNVAQTYVFKKSRFDLPRKMTKLHHDVAFLPVEDIDETLLLGRHINIQNKHGHTALHIAAFKGRLDVVKLLLTWQADPNIEDDNGDKPYDLVMKTLANNPLLELLRKVTIEEDAPTTDETSEDDEDDSE